MAKEQERNHYLDNAKFILMLLVVAGHLLEAYKGPSYHAVYKLLYLFHMPAFVMITGFFSRAETLPKLGNFIYQYFIFQTLYLLFERYVLLNTEIAFTYTRPYWLLWFLFSTILWKCALPYFAKLKPPVYLGAALALSLLAGFDRGVGYPFSASRTLTFLPFFLLGYALRSAGFSWLQKIPAWAPAPVFVFFFFMLRQRADIPANLLYGAASYAIFEYGNVQTMLYRLGFILCATVLIFCFLRWVPKGAHWFSALGQRSIAPYLLHGFIVKYLRHVGFFNTVQGPGGVALLLVAGLAVATVMMTKPVYAALTPFIAPGKIYRALQSAAKRGH